MKSLLKSIANAVTGFVVLHPFMTSSCAVVFAFSTYLIVVAARAGERQNPFCVALVVLTVVWVVAQIAIDRYHFLK